MGLGSLFTLFLLGCARGCSDIDQSQFESCCNNTPNGGSYVGGEGEGECFWGPGASIPGQKGRLSINCSTHTNGFKPHCACGIKGADWNYQTCRQIPKDYKKEGTEICGCIRALGN